MSVASFKYFFLCLFFCYVSRWEYFANAIKIGSQRKHFFEINSTAKTFEVSQSQTLIPESSADSTELFSRRESTESTVQRSTETISFVKNSVTYENTTNIMPTKSIPELWLQAEKNSKELITSLYRSILPDLVRRSGEMKITDQCMSSLLKLIFGIRRLKSWSIRMIDSTAKMPSGFLEGTIMALGAYDECLNIKVLNRNEDKEAFRGKYCLIEGKLLLPEKPKRVSAKTFVINDSMFDSSMFKELSRSAHFFYYFNYIFGVCVPSTCNKEDVGELVKNVETYIFAKTFVSTCHVKEPVRLDVSQTAVICVFALFGLLTIVGTSLDLMNVYGGTQENNSARMNLEKNGKLVQTFFLAFSLYSNGKQLFDLNQRPGEISALNGIRFITLTWIILCHTYAFALLVSFRDLSDLQDSTEDLAFEVILNGWVSVDTFFFLSGLLVAYITLRRLEKSKGKMNFGLYLFHRYWRLTPTLMLVISILILMEGLGSGPLWDMQVRSEAERCRSSWWANLLYINNWRDHKYRCLPHLWYISVDMQLYVISLLILIPLFWKPIVGFLVLFLMVLGSNLAVGLLTAFNNYFPTVLHLAPDAKFNEEIVMNIYWKPYTHMGPYCVGIIVAYLILHYRDTVIDPALQVFLWIIAITCNVSTLYGAYEFNRGNLPPAWEAGLYASLYHTVWAVGLGWLTFACATGRGGLINSFLSWKIFLPLGRLTYSAYLCHFVIFWVRNGLQRERRNFSHFEQSFDFAGYITMTMFIALGVYLLFEAPFGALEKLMFPRGRQNKDDVKTKQDTETSAPTFGRWKQCSSKTAVVLKQVNFKENIFTLPTENT